MEALPKVADHLETGVLARVPALEEQEKQFPPPAWVDTPNDRFLSLTEPSDAETIIKAVRLDPLTIEESSPPSGDFLLRCTLKNVSQGLLVLPRSEHGSSAQYAVARWETWIERLDSNRAILPLSERPRRDAQYKFGEGTMALKFPILTPGESLPSTISLSRGLFREGWYRFTVELHALSGDLIDRATFDIGGPRWPRSRCVTVKSRPGSSSERAKSFYYLLVEHKNHLFQVRNSRQSHFR